MSDMSDMSGKSVCSADDVTGISSEVSDSDVTDALQPSDKDSSEQLHGGTKPTSSVAEEAVAVSCSSKTYKEEVLQRANSQAKSGALKQHVSRWDTREHNTRHITSNSGKGKSLVNYLQLFLRPLLVNYTIRQIHPQLHKTFSFKKMEF